MWLCACVKKQKKRHIPAKTTSARHYIYSGVGSRDLFMDEANTALGIFPVFFPCMLPTPLCGIFVSSGKCCLLLTTHSSARYYPTSFEPSHRCSFQFCCSQFRQFLDRTGQTIITKMTTFSSLTFDIPSCQ